jgi:hypothetical protein
MRSTLLLSCLFLSLFVVDSFAQWDHNSLQSLGVMARETGLEQLDAILHEQDRFFQEQLDTNLDVYLYNDEDRPSLIVAPSNHYTAKVAIGNRLMVRYVAVLPEKDWRPAITLLLGHAAGQALINKRGHYYSKKDKQLLADFLAGYYFGRAQHLSYSELVYFCNRFFHLANVGFWDPKRQGTPTERYQVFLLGMEQKEKTPGEAYQAGRQHLGE